MTPIGNSVKVFIQPVTKHTEREWTIHIHFHCIEMLSDTYRLPVRRMSNNNNNSSSNTKSIGRSVSARRGTRMDVFTNLFKEIVTIYMSICTCVWYVCTTTYTHKHITIKYILIDISLCICILMMMMGIHTLAHGLRDKVNVHMNVISNLQRKKLFNKHWKVLS